jgi:hypothetical protein
MGAKNFKPGRAVVGNACAALLKGIGFPALDGCEGLPVPPAQIDFAQLWACLGRKVTGCADNANGFQARGKVAASDGVQCYRGGTAGPKDTARIACASRGGKSPSSRMSLHSIRQSMS